MLGRHSGLVLIVEHTETVQGVQARTARSACGTWNHGAVGGPEDPVPSLQNNGRTRGRKPVTNTGGVARFT